MGSTECVACAQARSAAPSADCGTCAGRTGWTAAPPRRAPPCRSRRARNRPACSSSCARTTRSVRLHYAARLGSLATPPPHLSHCLSLSLRKPLASWDFASAIWNCAPLLIAPVLVKSIRTLQSALWRMHTETAALLLVAILMHVHDSAPNRVLGGADGCLGYQQPQRPTRASRVGTILLNALLPRASQVEKFGGKNSFAFFAAPNPPLPDAPHVDENAPQMEKEEQSDPHRPVRFLLRVGAADVDAVAAALSDAGLEVLSK